MSLELAIAENTRAINQLIAILRDQASNPVPQMTEPDTPAETEQPKTKRTKKEAKPEAPAGEPVPEQPAPSPETGASDASETEAVAAPTEVKQITYADAAAAVTALINANGRGAAVSLLQRFSARNLKEVDPARYGELIAAAQDEAAPL